VPKVQTGRSVFLDTMARFRASDTNSNRFTLSIRPKPASDLPSCGRLVAAREPAIGQGEQDAENELIPEAFSAQEPLAGLLTIDEDLHKA
jgi:hypothetical protein